MERDLVDRDSRALSENRRRHVAKRLGPRSRSPSPNPTRDSFRRYRERSRSPLRQSPGTGHSENYDNGGHHSRRDGHYMHRHRRQRDGASELDQEPRQEQTSHRSVRQHQRREQSPKSPRKRRLGDGEAEKQPSPRHNQRHRSRTYADSSLLPKRSALSPTPTPPNASVTRFPLPDQHDGLKSPSPNRHHRHSHRRSPSRAGTARHHRSRQSRRRSSTRSSTSLALSRRGEDGASLPYRARALSRWDFAAFEPLFSYYLELQKQLRIADLDEREVRGRWKSFVGKWNRGELAEGWYEPEMFLRVVRARSLEGAGGEGAGRAGYDGSGQVMTPPTTGTSMSYSIMDSVVTERPGRGSDGDAAHDFDDDGDDDDDWGPSLPGTSRHTHSRPGYGDASPGHAQTIATGARPGPAIPTLQDLDHRRTLETEEQQDRIADIRLARRADRHLQKERLEELAPRAEPGTRERQLEKRRAAADAAREMRDAAGAGGAGLEEVGDGELMGGAGEGAEDYRRVLASMQRRKTERELRREEVVRARNAEREERIKGYKEREEETVDMLKELARQRFG